MGYFNWNPDEPLIDQHPELYKRLISNRGGCRCFISPPCSACTSEIDEDEAEELGLVPYPTEQKPKENQMNCESLLKYVTPALTFEEQITLQKQVADKVLDRLEIIDPSCIVAGGAPRDWTMGKPASDIDIFLQIRQGVPMHQVIKQLQKALNFEGIEEAAYNRIASGADIEKTTALYRTNPDIQFVFNICIDEVNCQIICLNTSTYNIVDKFPFGICKVWYKNGVIRTTKAFQLALSLKVLVLTGGTYAAEDFYVKKMKEKFSYLNDWKFFPNAETFNRAYL